MNYIKFSKYLGIVLVLFSLTLGFMLDCGFFSIDEVHVPVSTSFGCFLLGMCFLCYVDEKLK